MQLHQSTLYKVVIRVTVQLGLQANARWGRTAATVISIAKSIPSGASQTSESKTPRHGYSTAALGGAPVEVAALAVS